MEELAQALSARLSMQIAVSSLPVVEEWMDSDMSRWLESIPMPLEMPSGDIAEFHVWVGSDLSRLWWNSHGDPGGYVAKLANYLSKSGARRGDIDLINSVGETFEPHEVGSWIHAEAGKLSTGWEFEHAFDIAALKGVLGESSGMCAFLDWALSKSLDQVCALSGAIKSSQLAASVTLSSDQLELAMEAFTTFGGGGDVGAIRKAVTDLSADVFRLTVVAEGETCVAVELIAGGVASEKMAPLCVAVGAEFDNNVLPLQGALGATGIDAARVSMRGGAISVDFHLIPGSRPDDAN